MSYYDDFIDGHEFDEIPYEKGWQLERPEYGSINKRIKTDNMVRDLSDDALCEMFFENSEDGDLINEIVKDTIFPAYDIAVRCYERNKMSSKQKNGLQNVLIRYLLEHKKEKRELEF